MQKEFVNTKGVIRIRKSKDRQHNGQKTDNTMAKRQTTQWPKDRQHNGQKTDNTMAKRQTTQWPKDRQHNGQKNKKKKDKQRSTKHYTKTKYRVARTPLKPGDELGRSGRVTCSCSNSDTRSVTLDTNPVQLITWYVLTGPFVRLFVSYHFITMHNIT